MNLGDVNQSMILFAIIFGTLFAVTLACIGAGFAVQQSQQNKRFRAMLRIANPTARFAN